MKYIWFGLFTQVLILTFIKPFILDFEIVAVLAVSVHIIFTMMILMSYRDKLKVIFLGAFFARIAFMLWDLYATHIWILPNSGADSIGFYNSAVAVSKDLSLLKDTLYGGLYAKTIGTLFYLTGPSQILARYINVLVGVSIIIIIYKILRLLSINPRIIKFIVLLGSFFPNSLIMSGIFLREIITTFFVVESLYYFIKWFKSTRYIDMLLSLIMVGLASIFHSGVISIAIGYSFAFLFYKKQENSFRFSARTVFAFSLIFMMASLGLTVFKDVLLDKFGTVDNINDIYRTANNRAGNSAYLTGITINNPIQLAIFAPIKSFFFLTAPLPMNWSGFIDIFTFFTDSILYLGTIIYYIKNKTKFASRKTLVISLLGIIISVALIFGIGVGNAGTAVRHRQKIVPIFLVLLAVMMDGKYNNK